MIMDIHTSRRTAVLCTREQTASWLFELPNQQRILRRMMSDKAALASYLNTRLLGVSPYLVEGEDGQLERAWRCTTLVQAIYVMLYLDLTGGATIKTCASRGCQNYFRSNNPRRIYCSTNPCANRASTRLSRGQEP
jgi:hypothetical protein